MKLMKYCCSLICIVALCVSIGLADNEKTHPEIRPDDYQWSMWISPSLPPGDQFERYAEMLASSLPALHLLSEAGVLAPTLNIIHTHAQLIIHVLEGTDGPHANLVPFEAGRRTVTDLLAPLEASLDLLERTNTRPNSGIVYMRGGLLWVIDWALPQLGAYAQEIFPYPAQSLQAEAAGTIIQFLMLRALDSAIACIEAMDHDSAAQKLLDTSAFLFAALGSPFSAQTRPVSGMGLYFLTHNLLGWTWFGS